MTKGHIMEEEDTQTRVLSIPVSMSENVAEIIEEEKPVFVPFPERGPEMTRLESWWKYNTTKDRWGYYPIETERNYMLLGIGYAILGVVAVFAFILVLN